MYSNMRTCFLCKCVEPYFAETCEKTCDCGPDSNCIWEARFGGDKICLCKLGYSGKRGKCVACDCGIDSSCEFISERWLKSEIKVCHCKPGYHDIDGQCVDKYPTNDGCKNNMTCLDLGTGVENICLKICNVNSDCGNSEICNKVCLRPCSVDSDCEKPMTCLLGTCYWKPCKKKEVCEKPLVCSNTDPLGWCVRECHCDNEGTCKYDNGRKICECKPGFSEKNGKCTACDCGVQGTCEFKNGQKKCYCSPGSEEKNGTCTECICRGGTCVKDGGREVCKCPSGFGNFTSTICKACDCGSDINCIWEAEFGGNKVCLCKPGYSTKKGKCVECECGSDFNCEWISEGWLKPEKKVCHCKPGYHEENGMCVDSQDLKTFSLNILKKFP